MPRKRDEYYYVNPIEGEGKRLFYKISLGEINFDKEIFDRMVERFGEKKVIKMIRHQLIKEIDVVYCLLRPYVSDIEKYGGIDKFIDHYVGFDNEVLFIKEEEEEL